MKVVVISRPDFFPGEDVLINKMLRVGLPLIHIRKPDADISEVEKLLLSIDPVFYNRVVMNDFHSLAVKYNLHGVHLNKRNPSVPANWNGSVSCSTHSLSELQSVAGKYDYCFLSPIFSSISKENYNSGFTVEQLQKAASEGVVNEKVYALGGVTADRLPLLKSLYFGGAALLGEVWNNAENIERYMDGLLAAAL